MIKLHQYENGNEVRRVCFRGENGKSSYMGKLLFINANELIFETKT